MSAAAPPLTPATDLHEDEHRAFRDSVRTFLERKVAPQYETWRADRRMPREIFRLAAQDGFLAMQVPERHGGLGIDDPRFAAIVAEEAMCAGARALALALIGHEAAVSALVRHGSHEQRDDLLPRLASAETLAAVVTGDVHAENGTVSGNAQFVVQGLDADLLVVLTPSATVLATSDAPGVTIEPSAPAIGLDAAGLADIDFDHAPAAPLETNGDALAAELELGLAITAVAGARAALATTTEYVQDRKAFGQPIASFENTRDCLARASANLQAGEAFVEQVLRERLAGPLPRRRAAALRLHCAELYGAIVDTGVQLHGGYGYILEYPIAHMYADARFWRLHAASS
jgi:acyl-CoA dehydrogenase